MKANYSARCKAECGVSIRVGDEIRKSEDETGWIHAECEEMDRLGPVTPQYPFSGTSLADMGY